MQHSKPTYVPLKNFYFVKTFKRIFNTNRPTDRQLYLKNTRIYYNQHLTEINITIDLLAARSCREIQRYKFSHLGRNNDGI